MTRFLKSPLLAAMLLAAFPIVASELETDWIQPVKGSREATLGAEIRAVEQSGDEGTKVTISIPKASVRDQSEIEEVVVYGQRQDKSEPRLDIRHEWVADYDKDNYGLVLYLGKNSNIPLRLYLKTQESRELTP